MSTVREHLRCTLCGRNTPFNKGGELPKTFLEQHVIEVRQQECRGDRNFVWTRRSLTVAELEILSAALEEAAEREREEIRQHGQG